MMTNQRIRRLVAWADFTPESDRAAQWAARHAEARALPLHLLHTADVSVPAARSAARTAGRGPDEAHPVEAVHLALDADQLTKQHRGLTVTTQVVEGDHGRPAAEHLEPGDVLVTGTFGYRELGAGPGPDPRPATALGVPIVIVPADPRPTPPRRRLLLLTASHLPGAAAAFAFTTAADLGATLDVVRVAPQSAAFGDDYWIDSVRQPYRVESRLKAALDATHHQHPQVVWNTATLRVGPWRTLRAMAESAQLAILPGDYRTASAALRVLLDAGSCPVVLVPPG